MLIPAVSGVHRRNQIDLGFQQRRFGETHGLSQRPPAALRTRSALKTSETRFITPIRAVGSGVALCGPVRAWPCAPSALRSRE